jgi:hypothetical protein
MGIMKTTVEISDTLLREARKFAAHEGTTLRAVIERGLRHAIQQTSPRKPFKLRRASFAGSGRQAGFTDADWDHVRDAIY